MAYDVIFDKSTSVHGGIEQLRVEDGRGVAVYTDETTIDLGPYLGQDQVVYSLRVNGHTMEVDDASLVRNYGTLYQQLVEAGTDSNALHKSGTEIVTGTKSFQATSSDTSNTVTGTVALRCGAGQTAGVVVSTNVDGQKMVEILADRIRFWDGSSYRDLTYDDIEA